MLIFALVHLGGSISFLTPSFRIDLPGQDIIGLFSSYNIFFNSTLDAVLACH